MKYTIDGQPTDVIPLSPDTEGLQDIHRAIREAQHRETWARVIEAAALQYKSESSPDTWDYFNEAAQCIRNLPCPPLEKEKPE